jgi:HTH-type transcriptional regulator / antitoxin HigA
MTNITAAYQPDWVSPPGDTLLDILAERDWTQAELAQRLGYTTKHVNQLIKGKVPLTDDAAIRLERVVGSTAGFWLTREAKFREHCARLDAAKRTAGWVDWLDDLPIKELMAAGVIEKCRIDARSKPCIVEYCLRFFGVASPDEWRSHYGQTEASFRRSRPEQTDVGAIASWLRMGEQKAEKLNDPKFDRAKFITALAEVRKLTSLPPEQFEPRLRTLFSEVGVAFVLVPSIPKARVSGVARWINPHRPLIQLSLYGKTNDKFWFTLFHEVAHILFHCQEKKSVYLDDPSQASNDSPEEQEANQWASEFLIPAKHHAELLMLSSKASVTAFSKKLGIHPGIVVGRLQHDEIIGFNWLNELKSSFRFHE